MPELNADILRHENVAAPLPAWTDRIPDEVKVLLREIYASKALGSRALPAMGIRAAIDLVSVKIIGKDLGAFPVKLKRLLDDQHLTRTQHEALSAVVDAGSAAAHRGFVPDADSLESMLDALNHLLQSVYSLKQSANELREKTPPR